MTRTQAYSGYVYSCILFQHWYPYLPLRRTQMMEKAERLKARGNEKFKQGNFADAIAM